MRTLEFPKVKWQNIVIVLLLLSLMAGTALPAMADVIKIRPLAISRSVTLVVAANDAPALSKAQADYVCDSINDHVQIQAAIDALPATGGKILLTQGTFNIESSITLDSYQTLQGMGRNTILTAAGYITVIDATGSGVGSEKEGIFISDLQIDGASTGDLGIYFNYIADSTIQNVYVKDFIFDMIGSGSGIKLLDSTANKVINCICENNEIYGIWLAGIVETAILFNISRSNGVGIIIIYSPLVDPAQNLVINNNICDANTYTGISVSSVDRILLMNNSCHDNGTHGIFLTGSDHNYIMGNQCTENSQTTTNTSDDIHLTNSDYNFIQANICRAGGETNKPRYGININEADCGGNKVINNDLYDDGFGTAPYNDSGTGTIYVEPGIDDTPVNGETAQPISSNWAYDHNVLTFGVHGIPADPGADRYLMWDDVPGELVWATAAGGGDVTGPASSTDNAIARFHLTTGKIIQDYTSNPPTISDTGDMNIDGDLDVENIVVSGNVDGVDISAHAADGTAHQSNVITITFLIDGGGSAITTGQKGHIELPFACTITGWTLLGDQSGSIVIDVWNDTYANFPPTVADTIAGSEKPTLSAVQKNQDLALTTWTTAVSAGDILAFNVDSVATIERVTLSIRATKT